MVTNYFSQGQIWQRYCLLRQYAIAQAGRRAASAPACLRNSLIPHRMRQTLVAGSCLCNQTLLPQAFWKPVLTTKCQQWNEITNAVTVYLCKDMVPFQNVDRKGFKEMVKTLDPRYALHARTHFSQIEMPKLYGKVCKQVEKQIHTIKHKCFSEMEVTWEKILIFFMRFCCLSSILPLQRLLYRN